MIIASHFASEMFEYQFCTYIILFLKKNPFKEIYIPYKCFEKGCTPLWMINPGILASCLALSKT